MSASGEASQLTQNIRDQFLQCKICLDGLKEPKTLPCLHTFCADCIICYAEHNLIDNCKFSCPICRRNVYIPRNGIEGFPDSFFVQSLNDVLEQTADPDSSRSGCGICKFKDAETPATMMCVDCKINLCDDCSKKHGSAPVTVDHTLLALGSGSDGSLKADNFCRVHRGEVIKYYCETCNSPICLPCTFLEHNGHQVIEIKTVRSTFVDDMSRLVAQSQDSTLQLQQAKDNLVELENELFVRRESIKTDIRRCIQEILKSVNEQETRLVAEIDEYFDTVSVARDRQLIDRTLFRLSRAHDFAKMLLSDQTSPIAQIVNMNEAKENLRQALAYEISDITRHASKLDNYMYFLPHQTSVNLGKLLKGNGLRQSTAVVGVRRGVPSVRACFLYQLRPTEASALFAVLSVGVLPGGDVVVLSSEAKMIKVFNGRGQLRYEFGDQEDLLHPSDMVITNDGDIAVADCGYRCVKVYDRIGTLTRRFGRDDMFGLPIALTTDDRGRFIVCDQAKERITVHRPTGEIIFEANMVGLKTPRYVACGGEKLFVCDTDNSVIAVFAYARDRIQFVVKLSTESTEFGQFLDFAGVCCDRSGNLLVADRIKACIHVLNQNADLSRIITSGRNLVQPQCLSVSGEGLLAVCQNRTTLDTDVVYEVSVYRLMKTDI